MLQFRCTLHTFKNVYYYYTVMLRFGFCTAWLGLECEDVFYVLLIIQFYKMSSTLRPSKTKTKCQMIYFKPHCLIQNWNLTNIIKPIRWLQLFTNYKQWWNERLGGLTSSGSPEKRPGLQATGSERSQSSPKLQIWMKAGRESARENPGSEVVATTLLLPAINSYFRGEAKLSYK